MNFVSVIDDCVRSSMTSSSSRVNSFGVPVPDIKAGLAVTFALEVQFINYTSPRVLPIFDIHKV